jgi:geranylgeranyl diphosphate synthase type I
MTDLLTEMFSAIETSLHTAVDRSAGPGMTGLHAMLAYHLGWEGADAGPEATGKRLRPLFVLLTTAAAGGDWRAALPAAAAVELIHNFSLLHDDIEDDSPRRRGRPTVWVKWGVPQAINAGDTMFTLAHLAILDLRQSVSAEIALTAAQRLQHTCLELTQGQYLDISYENRTDLVEADYWPMVSGKTAALLAGCTELGALVAQAPAVQVRAYREFGRSLGLAYQAQDDLLGIWGAEELTGKSNASDLISGKKSLPVLYGLEQDGAFARRWRQGQIAAAEVPALAAQLALEGGRDYTAAQVTKLTAQAQAALAAAQPQGEAGQELHALADRLTQRAG